MHTPIRFATLLLFASLAFSQIHDPTVVPGIYIVELKEESAASFAMRARTTAQARRTVMHSRRGSVRASQQAFRKAAGIFDHQVLSSMDTLHNAITVRMSEAQIARLRGHRLVKEIYPVHEMVSSADKAIAVLKIPEVWQSLGGSANAGAGIKIGIVDTGIDETHPAFQAPSLAIPPGFPKYDNVADIGQTNNKVIVARNYTAALFPVSVDLEDQVGHGTAVGMAAAGMPHTGPEGTSLSGVAPGAWLGNYKVGVPSPTSRTGNSRGDVILKALNDAAADGMDVINMSFAIQGTWLGLTAEAALFDSAAKRLAALGILFVVAAGNDGPERNSIGSSPSYAHLLVGGTNNSRLLGGTVGVSDGASYTGIPPSPPYVLPSAPVSGVLINVADLEPTGKGCGPYAAGSLANRVALIRNPRTCSAETYLNRMATAGAVGALVYADGFQDPPQFATTATLPVMAIGFEDGDAIVTKLHNTPGLTATLTLARNSISVNANRIAGLSARGPDPNYAIRPDFVTVAQYIYAAAPGNAFQFVSGTSLAAPFAAGGAAILRGMRPNLTVDQYFSLLTNTATPLSAGWAEDHSGDGARRRKNEYRRSAEGHNYSKSAVVEFQLRHRKRESDLVVQCDEHWPGSGYAAAFHSVD